MVFYYTLPPKAAARGFRVYMGRDKYENEDLLKYGWENDVWFHVDGLSSAHVYLRLPEDGCTWEEIPPVVMKYCCQLVKNNSIEGCKKKECWVIYTPFTNLHKDPNTMQTGAVSFHDGSLRRRVRVEKDKELVKRIEKTKSEDTDTDFAAEKAAHDALVLQRLKQAHKAAHRQKQREKSERAREQSEFEARWAVGSSDGGSGGSGSIGTRKATAAAATGVAAAMSAYADVGGFFSRKFATSRTPATWQKLREDDDGWGMGSGWNVGEGSSSSDDSSDSNED